MNRRNKPKTEAKSKSRLWYDSLQEYGRVRLRRASWMLYPAIFMLLLDLYFYYHSNPTSICNETLIPQVVDGHIIEPSQFLHFMPCKNAKAYNLARLAEHSQRLNDAIQERAGINSSHVEAVKTADRQVIREQVLYLNALARDHLPLDLEGVVDFLHPLPVRCVEVGRNFDSNTGENQDRGFFHSSLCSKAVYNEKEIEGKPALEIMQDRERLVFSSLMLRGEFGHTMLEFHTKYQPDANYLLAAMKKDESIRTLCRIIDRVGEPERSQFLNRGAPHTRMSFSQMAECEPQPTQSWISYFRRKIFFKFGAAFEVNDCSFNNKNGIEKLFDRWEPTLGWKHSVHARIPFYAMSLPMITVIGRSHPLVVLYLTLVILISTVSYYNFSQGDLPKLAWYKYCLTAFFIYFMSLLCIYISDLLYRIINGAPDKKKK